MSVQTKPSTLLWTHVRLASVQTSMATHMIRVLQVTPRFAPLVGGVETHVWEVAQRLSGHGVECSVLTADASGELAAHEMLGGVLVTRVRAYPTGRDWMFAPGLPAALRAQRWDVIHVQSYHTLFAPLAMAAAARARLPYVLTFHGGGHDSVLRNVSRAAQIRALGPLLRRARALVAIADFEIAAYGELAKVAPQRFVKIPNGAGIPEAVESVPTAGTLIVSIGRLERYKGHRRIIAALPYVLEQVPDVKLWIAGDGPDRPTLQRLAQRLGVSEHVEIGAADRLTLARRLKGAALATLLSDFESQPLAVLEAAALGVPVLVADNSGMRELAQQGLADMVGLSASPQVHAQAMLDAMNRPRLTAPLSLPTWDDCAAALADLYRAVVT
ncbi:MAG: glycosyltransferase family 4 protein [Solirubrobacteraceae bacterium]